MSEEKNLSDVIRAKMRADVFEFSTDCSKLGKRTRLLETECNGGDDNWDFGDIIEFWIQLVSHNS